MMHTSTILLVLCLNNIIKFKKYGFWNFLFKIQNFIDICSGKHIYTDLHKKQQIQNINHQKM